MLLCLDSEVTSRHGGCAVTGDLSRSVLPALTGIEGRLTDILQSSGSDMGNIVSETFAIQT